MNVREIATMQELAIEWLYEQREDELRYQHFRRPDQADEAALFMQAAANYLKRPDTWTAVKKPHKTEVVRYYVNKN